MTWFCCLGSWTTPYSLTVHTLIHWGVKLTQVCRLHLFPCQSPGRQFDMYAQRHVERTGVGRAHLLVYQRIVNRSIVHVKWERNFGVGARNPSGIDVCARVGKEAFRISVDESAILSGSFFEHILVNLSAFCNRVVRAVLTTEFVGEIRVWIRNMAFIARGLTKYRQTFIDTGSAGNDPPSPPSPQITAVETAGAASALSLSSSLSPSSSLTILHKIQHHPSQTNPVLFSHLTCTHHMKFNLCSPIL